MANEIDDFQETFMNVATKKMEDHDKRLVGLEEKAKNQPDHSKDIMQLKGEMSNVTEKVNIISFPVKEVNQLSVNLGKAIDLLRNPVEQKVMHHHYLNKGLWVSIGMFFVVVILVVLLVNAWSRINENRESDIKYRHLKLNKNEGLRELLRYEDSICLADPDMLLKYVIGEEARRKEKAELLLLSKEKEEESKQLKKKAENK